MDLSARTKGFQAVVRQFPIGPCSFVSPFNFPLNLAAHKIAPALAVGCVFSAAILMRPCLDDGMHVPERPAFLDLFLLRYALMFACISPKNCPQGYTSSCCGVRRSASNLWRLAGPSHCQQLVAYQMCCRMYSMRAGRVVGVGVGSSSLHNESGICSSASYEYAIRSICKGMPGGGKLKACHLLCDTSMAHPVAGGTKGTQHCAFHQCLRRCCFCAPPNVGMQTSTTMEVHTRGTLQCIM